MSMRNPAAGVIVSCDEIEWAREGRSVLLRCTRSLRYTKIQSAMVTPAFDAYCLYIVVVSLLLLPLLLVLMGVLQCVIEMRSLFKVYQDTE